MVVRVVYCKHFLVSFNIPFLRRKISLFSFPNTIINPLSALLNFHLYWWRETIRSILNHGCFLLAHNGIIEFGNRRCLSFRSVSIYRSHLLYLSFVFHFRIVTNVSQTANEGVSLFHDHIHRFQYHVSVILCNRRYWYSFSWEDFGSKWCVYKVYNLDIGIIFLVIAPWVS